MIREESTPTELVLGPILRYAGTESATFWVETSAPCEVEILGQRTPTFTVEGHHYALLLVDDLEPASVTPYDVRLDGRLVWPPDDGRPAPGRPHARRRAAGAARLRLVPGRRAAADIDSSRPWPDELGAHRGRRALDVRASSSSAARSDWPDALLLLGDQVYADEVSPETRDVHPWPTRHERAAGRADRRLRGVHAALPRVVVGPGHPLAALDRAERDDLRRPRRQRRLEHLLELGRGDARAAVVGRADHRRVHVVLDLPAHRQPLAARARRGGDAPRSSRPTTTRDRACARRARRWDRESAASRWAYYRDFGDSRLLVLDSRAARVLADGRREMIDEEEWDWIVEHSLGAFDHLVIASTLPVFMPHGIHHLEAWNEAVCDGRWGTAAARLAERLRRARRPRALGGVQHVVRAALRLAAPDRGREPADAGRPRRSCCSAATSTTPTSPRSISGRRTTRAASSRSCARRSATRSSPKERRIVRAHRLDGGRRSSSRCSRGWPACRRRPPTGASSAARPSTTRSASSSSTVAPPASPFAEAGGGRERRCPPPAARHSSPQIGRVAVGVMPSVRVLKVLVRRLGPLGLALTAYDVWRRLPTERRWQLRVAARRHGSWGGERVTPVAARAASRAGKRGVAVGRALAPVESWSARRSPSRSAGITSGGSGGSAGRELWSRRRAAGPRVTLLRGPTTRWRS